ncbi:rCG63710 [Rattus norvegicus]|uniref:RCG63710 n=1 Tax=Rattus norvegicus TaxID=10116 RepID=A6IG71_RAT|nr:rCG63710 [Rattus norvegicus]
MCFLTAHQHQPSKFFSL